MTTRPAPRAPSRWSLVAALVGLSWAGWISSTFTGALLGGSFGAPLAPTAATATLAGIGVALALLARRLCSDATICIAAAIAVFAGSATRAGPTVGLTQTGVIPWWAITPLTAGLLGPVAIDHIRRRAGWLRWAVAVTAPLLVVLPGQPAGAWIASASLRTPTPTMALTHNVDLVVDTHQWLARQAMTILAADGRSDIAAFLARPDPMAPPAVDLVTGVPTGTTETYGWRLLQGARDADGTLYSQIPDHFHNWWTHQGRWWVVGGSAANGAEKAFAHAEASWAAGDRSDAVYWLGAALHLVDDACVPQHEFFGVNVYHHEYELWVQIHQDELAVSSGGIYAEQFRVGTGHGGEAWSSGHPRGWVDECAHRAADNLLASTHNNLPTPSARGPQWRTAPHIADTQRLSAGFIAFFFERVQGP